MKSTRNRIRNASSRAPKRSASLTDRLDTHSMAANRRLVQRALPGATCEHNRHGYQVVKPGGTPVTSVRPTCAKAWAQAANVVEFGRLQKAEERELEREAFKARRLRNGRASSVDLLLGATDAATALNAACSVLGYAAAHLGGQLAVAEARAILNDLHLQACDVVEQLANAEVLAYNNRASAAKGGAR